MQRHMLDFLKNKQTVNYAVVEPALRDGDIILYDFHGDPRNIHAGVAPVKRSLLSAALLGHLCSLLPCNVCWNDVSESRDATSTSSTTTTTTGDACEVTMAEMRMEHSWKTWQHATLVVVIRDETHESNPERVPTKMLPYVFVPNSKSKLHLIPLRALVAQCNFGCFAVRHLLINEAIVVSGSDGGGNSSPAAVPRLSSSSKNALSTGTRSFIQKTIIDLYIAITERMRYTDDASTLQRAQVIDLLLRQPAPVVTDKKNGGTLTTKSSIVTASHEYLASSSTTTAESSSSISSSSSSSSCGSASDTKMASLTELLPLFHASPANLALYALYVARVSSLLPRAYHGAAHLCDSGLLDHFLASAYSYSDEVTVRFV